MINCIIFYNSSKKCFQSSRFFDEFEILAKCKMAAILAAILDDVTSPQHCHNP